jgi:hypothetical protein
MRARRFFFASILVLLPSLLAACGGKVVVDAPGEGTGGAGGSSNAATCVSACEKSLAQCPSGGPTDCAQGCATLDKETAGCPELYATFLACWEAHPEMTCNASGNACLNELQSMTSCITQACNANPSLCTSSGMSGGSGSGGY